MAWQRVQMRQLHCDDCGGCGPIALTRLDAAREAVAIGWEFAGASPDRAQAWRCPDCVAAAAPPSRLRERLLLVPLLLLGLQRLFDGLDVLG
jgi:hypothetical protein